jgi:hypothetical protein
VHENVALEYPMATPFYLIGGEQASAYEKWAADERTWAAMGVLDRWALFSNNRAHIRIEMEKSLRILCPD